MEGPGLRGMGGVRGLRGLSAWDLRGIWEAEELDRRERLRSMEHRNRGYSL